MHVASNSRHEVLPYNSCTFRALAAPQLPCEPTTPSPAEKAAIVPVIGAPKVHNVMLMKDSSMGTSNMGWVPFGVQLCPLHGGEVKDPQII